MFVFTNSFKKSKLNAKCLSELINYNNLTLSKNKSILSRAKVILSPCCFCCFFWQQGIGRNVKVEKAFIKIV